MSPLPPSGNVIVTNDGVITPYVREQVSEYSSKVEVSLNADANITYIDVYGFEDKNIMDYDFPPASNIQEVVLLENNVVRVIASEPWMPAPFELKFELQLEGGSVCDFFVTFE